MLRCMVVLALCLVAASDKKAPPKRIAIIGGGIGGTSASQFIREQYGPDMEIDLFEPAAIGGRMSLVKFAGREYESGASIIHPKNLYMKYFADKLGLQTGNSYTGTLGIFDGASYLLRTSSWAIITFLKMLWTFGLDLLRLNWLEDKFMENFEKIYDLQSEGESYSDVASLLHAMGGDQFVDSVKMTAEALFREHGISQFMVDNLISPALRVNYGQNASASGFVGTVAMAGIQSGLWSVKGGNKLVCEKLVVSSSTSVWKERVSSVKFMPEGKEGKFSILTEESPESERIYDIVILTAPIGRDEYDIDLTQACEDIADCPSAFETDPHEYRKTTANFVRGKLRSTVFQCDGIDDCPSAVLVTNQQTFYRSIGLHMPVDYEPENDKVQPVYKVFSTNPLTEDQLKYLFEVRSETIAVEWRAYPYYHPPEKLPPLVLNKAGLYYTSPIEWAASAMEMSAISAKNAVLLSYNHWYGRSGKIYSNAGGTGDNVEQKSEL